jgi:hypothetical protein
LGKALVVLVGAALKTLRREFILSRAAVESFPEVDAAWLRLLKLRLLDAPEEADTISSSSYRSSL